MAEPKPLGKVPESWRDIWNNLSFQMRGHIKAFGLPTRDGNLSRSDFTREGWRRLSFQMRAHILAKPSMEKEIRQRRENDWQKIKENNPL